ncbi:hypothetical protein EET67_23945 [Pseudaminobacter arsenicus]|uniref:DNA packaging protein n=1 Tax=Borborobacter arsenicus TaxID=1851146 RepID=A0A432UZV7_9HYPH|nr:hypothetical protein [Pseudaminobacter arsenicus]RUM95332.1 hypothetical protein EET67_23945 [Pseudaminobacter arsenicus]
MNASAGTITLQQAARLLMISDERVRQLSKAGYFQPIAHGRYPLVAVVQGYFRYRDDRRQKAEQAASSSLTDAKLAAIERRMAREDRHLIAMDEALDAYDHVASVYVDSLRSLPERMTRNLAERRRLDAIVAVDVRRLERDLAIGRQRLATGQDEPEPEDDD